MEAYNAGDRIKRDEEIGRAVSAMRDTSGEEVASQMREAFLEFFNSPG